MKLFLYENVGPLPLNKSDTNSMQSHVGGALPGLRTRSKKIRDHEFADILEAVESELDHQIIIFGRQPEGQSQPGLRRE